MSSFVSNFIFKYCCFIGGKCPKGKYCPANSSVGLDCGTGTFLDTEGAKTSDECKNCTAGSFCNGRGLSDVSGECEGGYYCPGGQSTGTPVDYICNKGSLIIIEW